MFVFIRMIWIDVYSSKLNAKGKKNEELGKYYKEKNRAESPNSKLFLLLCLQMVQS